MPTNVRPTLKEVEATASKEYTNLWGTLRKRRSRLEKAGKCTEAEAVSLQISQLPDREAFCQTALEKYRAQYREQYKHRKNPKTDRFATPGSPAPPSPVSTPATAAAAGLPLRSPPPNYNQLLPPSVARASPEVILQYLDSLTMTSLARGNDNVAIAIGTHFARRSAPPSPAPACNAPMMYPLSPSPGLLPALNAGTPNAWAPSVGAPNAGALNGAWTPRPPPVPKKFGRKVRERGSGRRRSPRGFRPSTLPMRRRLPRSTHHRTYSLSTWKIGPRTRTLKPCGTISSPHSRVSTGRVILTRFGSSSIGSWDFFW